MVALEEREREIDPKYALMVICMSELHMQYSEYLSIPSLELRGIMEALRQTRQKQHDSMQHHEDEEEIDCDLVSAEDYRKWFHGE